MGGGANPICGVRDRAWYVAAVAVDVHMRKSLARAGASSAPVLSRTPVGGHEQILSPRSEEFAASSAARTHGAPVEDRSMSLDREYNQWYERVIAANPEYADETSPWYKLVLEHLVPVAEKHVLEV